MKFSILVCPTTICIIIILLYNKFFYPICQTKLFFLLFGFCTNKSFGAKNKKLYGRYSAKLDYNWNPR